LDDECDRIVKRDDRGESFKEGIEDKLDALRKRLRGN
jgi:hypothetical protein